MTADDPRPYRHAVADDQSDGGGRIPGGRLRVQRLGDQESNERRDRPGERTSDVGREDSSGQRYRADAGRSRGDDDRHRGREGDIDRTGQRADRSLSPEPPIAFLMRLSTGAWSFKTFATAVDMGVFTFLDKQPEATSKTVAEGLGLTERGADTLLIACTAMGLLSKNGLCYSNTPLAAQRLVSGKSGYFGDWVAYIDRRQYKAWDRIGESLRTGRPVTWDPETHDSVFAADDPLMLQLFWKALDNLSVPTAEALHDAYDFAKHKRLLDVGGGSGAFSTTLCRKNPQLTATVVELPHVCAIADEKINAAGLEDVITTQDGDFFDALPPGHDIILLSNILHDWDVENGRKLLENCFTALEPGGAVLVCELFLDDDKTGPLPAALMGMNMVVQTKGGRNYSGAEICSWLTEAGFTDPRVIPLNAAGANSFLIASKS